MRKPMNTMDPMPIQKLPCLGEDVVKCVLVSTGELGKSLLRCHSHFCRNIRIAAVLDWDPGKIGGMVGGVPVYPMDRLSKVVKKWNVEAAILAVPAESVQKAADQIVAAGIRGLLNFSPARPSVPRWVCLRSVDLANELEKLILFTKASFK